MIDSPHSGTLFPDDFAFACSAAELRQSEDSYVDQFADSAPMAGAAVLKALVSRAYIDLNRALTDLHPDLCHEPIPWQTHRSKRVMYGMGLIRHLVRLHEPVYAAPLPLAEIEWRIAHYYQPYYAALGSEIASLKRYFSRVLHINLHAMPQLGVDGAIQPDIVLGDHDGHSCGRPYRELVKRFFEGRGLKVVVNNPYKGVELTRKFARPRQGVHSLQIEVNKALYMNEQTLAVTGGMPALLAVFDALWGELAAFFETSALPKAAE